MPRSVDRSAQAALKVSWPDGTLYPNSVHEIRVVLPARITRAQLKCDVPDKCAWVSGPGKNAHSTDFTAGSNGAKRPWTVLLQLGIRNVDKPCREPVNIAVYDQDNQLFGEASGQIHIEPEAEAPAPVRVLQQTLAWILGAQSGLSRRNRLFQILGRLALLGAASGFFHYSKASHPLIQFETDLGIDPAPVSVTLDPHNLLPFEDFFRAEEAQTKSQWAVPDAWHFEQGDAINPEDLQPNLKDGKLCLVGPGTGTYPQPFALYDFDMAMSIELQPKGSATWFVRAQRGARRGYQFTITNKDSAVWLSAKAVGAKTSPFSRSDYSLLSFKESERMLDLGAPCCSATDRIQVQLRIKGFHINHQFSLQKLDVSSARFSSPLTDVDLEDPKHSFRFGGFQIVNDVPGRGAAYEYIRLLQAGKGTAAQPPTK